MSIPVPPKFVGFVICALVIALLLGSRSSARAQASFSFSSTTSNVSIAVNASDYNQATGQALTTVLDANSFLIRSNNSTWTLSVRAQSSTFAFVPSQGDANPGKSCGDLSIREKRDQQLVDFDDIEPVFCFRAERKFQRPAEADGNRLSVIESTEERPSRDLLAHADLDVDATLECVMNFWLSGSRETRAVLKGRELLAGGGAQRNHRKIVSTRRGAPVGAQATHVPPFSSAPLGRQPLC